MYSKEERECLIHEAPSTWEQADSPHASEEDFDDHGRKVFPVQLLLCKCLSKYATQVAAMVFVFVVSTSVVWLYRAQPTWMFPPKGDASCNHMGSDPTAIVVVTFNLNWWCTSNEYGTCPENAEGRGFDKLYATIREHPFDLIGFQQCDNVGQVVQNSGYQHCIESYNGGGNNDVGMAWNNEKYGWIDNGFVNVAEDKYGNRRVNWVRLAVRATMGKMFFANTHGPLDQCDGAEGQALARMYLRSIEDNKQAGDVVILTGHFNCGSETELMKELGRHFSIDATSTSDSAADHILSSGLDVLWEGEANGGPSEHQLLKVKYRLPSGS